MPQTRIALETGTQSGWISRSDRKNDRNNAEKRARYARLDPELLNPIEHRTAQQQTDLCAIRARDALVRARALLVNTARGLAKTEGLRLPPSITPTWGARSLKGLPLPLQTTLRPLLEQIDLLGKQLEAYDVLVEQIAAERYAEETQLLRSVPGVGPVTSLTYVLTLSDAQRFARSREVGPIWDCSRSSSNPVSAIHNSASAKQATDICASCWCNARITFWDTLDRIRVYGSGV